MLAEEKAREVLINYWGYSSFREKQEEIIKSVLEGNDTLALLPTGGGKSICFQVPAMCKEGICIVITPLIALMQDQVYQLDQKGIKALSVHSGMNYREIDITLDNAAYGNYKFLYVSPERLQTELFRARLAKMNVNLIAVDEAHCISQWGYDFRPAYLEIAQIRKELIDIPVIALTATATGKVIEDIQEKLEFKNKNLIRKSFLRENLSYVVLKDENPLQRMLKVINGVGGSGIVYVNTRKKTKEIANFLNQNKISASYFHAGLDFQDKTNTQTSWLNNQVQVIVATNAFGMGIDKSHVRFVVHLAAPSSIEAYFQEAGRAGRDGKKAYAVMLPSLNAASELKNSINKKYPSLEFIKRVYEALSNHLQIPVGGGLNQATVFDLTEFCEKYKLDSINTFYSLKILGYDNYLSLEEFTSSKSKIIVTMSKQDLYKFQVSHSKYDSFIKLLLRSYGGIFDNYCGIDESQLANRYNSTTKNIKELLIKLATYEVLEYIPSSMKPKITFLKPRIEKKYLIISKENYSERKKINQQQINAMVSYIESKYQCRSIQLLEYFGEKNLFRCGICDSCIERKKVALNDIEFDEIAEQIKTHLITASSTNELVDILKAYHSEKVIKVLDYLINTKIIKIEGDKLILN